MRALVRAGALFAFIAASLFGLKRYWSLRSDADLPTAPARKTEFQVFVRCRGNLSAARSQLITAPREVSDLTIVWLAPPGGAVKTGDPIIRFDRSRAEQDLKEKTAALKQAQASLDQAVAQARITSDQDSLDLETARYSMKKAKIEASKQAIVSAIQGEESLVDYEVAEEKVRVQEATANLHGKSDEAKIASLRRLRDEAQRELDRTKHQLEQMELRSPLNGIVTYQANYSQGWMNAQPYKVGDHAFPGGALAEIPDLSTLEMEAKLDEVDRGRVSIGDAVLVRVDAFPEKTVSAKLTAITPLTEQSFEEWPPVRSFKAYAALDHPDARMRPDMNASADFVIRKIPNAISVPAKAVFTVGGKPVVYVRSEGRFRPVPVEVAARNPDEVAVKGIAAGTSVALVQPEKAETKQEGPRS